MVVPGRLCVPLFAVPVQAAVVACRAFLPVVAAVADLAVDVVVFAVPFVAVAGAVVPAVAFVVPVDVVVFADPAVDVADLVVAFADPVVDAVVFADPAADVADLVVAADWY